jgi:hypothetical protein
MEPIPISGYYNFGFNNCLIAAAGMHGRQRSQVTEMLDTFFSELERLELQVTRVIAASLYDYRLELGSVKEEKISVAEGARIAEEMKKIDPALDAELSLKTAYVLTKKRYPLPSLLETPLSLLAASADTTLTATSKRDFSLACKLVALSEPTAAAFHLMRMLEEQVKVLYCAFKKTNRLDPMMWGPMTTQLKTKKAPKPSEKLLSHLDGMRQHFRNPTQHPELFYTMDEAQDLLNQTITAVNMVASELPKSKKP